AGGINGNLHNGIRVDMGRGRRSAVTGKSRDTTGVDDSGDDPLCIHHANAVIQRVGDVQIALGVKRDAGRQVKLGGGGWPAVAREGARAGRGAWHRRNDAFLVNPAYTAITKVTKIQIAIGSKC